MAHAILAISVTIVAWWLSTGVVLLASRQRQHNRAVVLTAATLVAIGSAYGLYASAQVATTAAVFVAFFSAIGIWAWSETTFLVGLITGPRRIPCPSDLVGWRRFGAAFLVVRDHELAILLSAMLVFALTFDGVNQTGLWTFAILWAMRISAKINIFLGAPNSVSILIPARLSYTTTYYRTDRVSPFFPFAIALAVVGLIALVVTAYRAEQSYQVAAWALLATFLALAIVEHFFLILPVSDAALWSWAGGSRQRLLDQSPRGATGKAGGMPPMTEMTAAKRTPPDRNSFSSKVTEDWPTPSVAAKQGGISWI